MEETKKHQTVKIVLYVILFINIFFGLLSTEGFNYFGLLNIFSEFFILFVALFLCDQWDNIRLKNKRIILSLIIRIVLSILILFSSIEIYLTDNYNLKYTYWIFYVSILSLLVIATVDIMVDKCKKVKENNEKFKGLKILGASLFYVFVICSLSYSLGKDFIIPQRVIAIEEFPKIQSLNIYEFSTDILGRHDINLNEYASITDQEDIEKIRIELSQMQLKNITLTDVKNYKKMKRVHKPCYYIDIIFKNDTQIKNIFGDSDILQIAITSNHEMALENIIFKDGFTYFKNDIKEIYPITISESTLNTILKYIN